MPEPVKGKSRYMAGLDGLRALAVLAVIAYHLNLPVAPGGLLGVSVFFVLSGYLITDLLAAQWHQDKRLDLKNFWLRRARRLLPALLLMLVVVVLWVAVLHPAQLAALRGDVLAAVLYISNWWFIFHHVSYFSSFGPPSPLGHLWSLAVEEQFYLLWPLLFLLGLRYAQKRGKLALLTLVAAAVSALAMAMLYQPGTDPSRVYYGTDTRAFALLIGAALALIWPSRTLSTKISSQARFSIDFLGSLGLTVVLFMVWSTNQYEGFLYRGGMVLVCIATAMTIAALAHPASRLGHVMGCQPLRWLGVRSYGIYLWHYPVIVLTTPLVNTGGISVPRAILQVTASIVLAALSWKFVEDPIRRGGMGRLWGKVRANGARRERLLGATTVLLALGVCCVGMSGFIPSATASSTFERPTQAKTGATSPQAEGAATPDPGTGNHTAAAATGVNASAGATTGSTVTSVTGTAGATQGPATSHGTTTSHPQGTTGPRSTPPTSGASHDSTGTQTTGNATGASTASGNAQTNDGQGITAIGDSVMIDIAPYLKQLLPGIVINAHVGRQMYQAPNTVTELKQQGQLGHIVIIELGTNGPFTKSQLVTLLQSLGNVQQIVLVNTRVPRPWQDVVNSTLRAVSASFPHTTLVDWYAASAGKSAYFYPDGVHLNPEGSKAYAAIVAKAVASAPAKTS